MYTKQLLTDKLLSFEYYLNKVPLYLRNSYGFIEHFRIFYWQVKTFAQESNKILYLLDIFNEDYMSFLESLEGYTSTESDILDKLCSVYAVTRKFSVGSTIFNLDNTSLLTLLKFNIIRNVCDGSREQQVNFFTAIGLNVIPITSDSEALTCTYLLIDSGSASTQIKDMFTAGVFNFKNIGVKTIVSTIITEVLNWDDTTYTWDNAGWSV